MRLRTGTLRNRLIVAFLLPALGLGTVFAALVYLEAQRALEREAGARLIAVATAVAGPLSAGRDAARIGSLTPEMRRVHANLRRKLEVQRAATGVRRIFVVDPELRSRVDTRDDVPVGAELPAVALDRHELHAVWSGGVAASQLFTAEDGQRVLHGYAPVVDTDGQVVAAVGVQGSADWFATLDRFALTLATAGVVLTALVVVGSVLVSRRITGPLGRLVDSAARMEGGDLGAPVPGLDARDEVGVLARRLDAMRRALRERDEELQMMLAGIAHEVRNPLGGMGLFAGLLREGLPADSEGAGHAARIEGEIARLGEVVEDFLHFARRRDIERSDVPLGAFLEDLAEDARVRAARTPGAGVEVVVALPDGDGVARFDPAPVRRAVVNLVDNGLHAMADGPSGTLTLAGSPGDAGWIEVRDTGRGIPPEAQEDVQRPFFTTREKGTGLGLALCRRTAEEHGGRLVLSSHPGEGTAVRIEWGP